MLVFLPLSQPALIEQNATKISGWIFESGPAFFSFLFGDRPAAEKSLGLWLRRPSSEFSGLRATLAVREQEPVGLLLGVRGPEISGCRRADLLALVQQSSADERAMISHRLKDISGLTAPVAAEDYYIRTIAVAEAERGKGLGRQVVERAIRDGTEAGFRRFRLDVDADNEPALRLYRGLGFEQIHEGFAPAAGLRMYSMLRCD